MTKEQEFRKQTEEAKFEAFSLMCKKVTELENKIADIKANCDLAIEGRDIKIKELEKELNYQKQARTIAENAVVELEKDNEQLKSTAEFQQSSNMKRHFEIQELEKENSELKKKCYKKAIKDYCELEQKNKELEKENTELKEWQKDTIKVRGNDYMDWSRMKDQLTKAKELLAKWVELYKPKLEGYPITPIQEQTEQFLEEEA